MRGCGRLYFTLEVRRAFTVQRQIIAACFRYTDNREAGLLLRWTCYLILPLLCRHPPLSSLRSPSFAATFLRFRSLYLVEALDGAMCYPVSLPYRISYIVAKIRLYIQHGSKPRCRSRPQFPVALVRHAKLVAAKLPAKKLEGESTLCLQGRYIRRCDDSSHFIRTFRLPAF
jgi:hypothetical protein